MSPGELFKVVLQKKEYHVWCCQIMIIEICGNNILQCMQKLAEYWKTVGHILSIIIERFLKLFVETCGIQTSGI